MHIEHRYMCTQTCYNGKQGTFIIWSYPSYCSWIWMSISFKCEILLIWLFLQKPGAEPPEEDEVTKRVDPLHQLILLFSRTALTEKWYGWGLRMNPGGSNKEIMSECSVSFIHVSVSSCLVRVFQSLAYTPEPTFIQFQALISMDSVFS